MSGRRGARFRIKIVRDNVPSYIEVWDNHVTFSARDGTSLGFGYITDDSVALRFALEDATDDRAAAQAVRKVVDKRYTVEIVP